MSYDILVHNGTVVTVNPDFDIIENGLVCIDGSRLKRIAPTAVNAPLPRAREVIDAHGGLILPGLVNTHTHLPMTLFRGLADDLPLKQWLEDFIFPAEARFVNRETVWLGTQLACAELLLSGTTTCCDGYFHADQIARALAPIGMRAVLGQGVIDFPAPGIRDPSQNISHAAEFVRCWHRADPLITPSVFCHSPYTCSEQTLRRAKAIVAEDGLLLQIHAAETQWERRHILDQHQRTPIGYLEWLGILDRQTLLVHAVWADNDDIGIMARRNCSVSHCPESSMKLAVGTAPIPQIIDAGIIVGLGTDGCASNNDMDLFAEMDTAAKLHKITCGDPTILNAAQVLKMATIDGAKAIGLGDEIGSLEPGKAADLIVIDTRRPHLTPLYHPVSQLVYAAGGPDVRHVVVAGKPLMRDRRLLTLDADALKAQMKTTAERIGGAFCEKESSKGRFPWI